MGAREGLGGGCELAGCQGAGGSLWVLVVDRLGLLRSGCACTVRASQNAALGDAAAAATTAAAGPDGMRSRCSLNGVATSVRVLREVGRLLVDVNGQHAALALK